MKITPFKRFFGALLIITLISSFKVTEDPENKVSKYKFKTIVIDAGHGGKDGSTRGIFSKEKDVTLKTALLLGKTIEENLKDVKVVYTRTTDVYPALYERIGLANKVKADLFISIHCNSMPIKRIRVVSGYKKDKRGRRVPVYTTKISQSTSTNGTETFVSGFGRVDEQDVALRENASILLEKDYKDNYEGYDPNDPESIIILSLMKNAYRDKSIRLATLIQKEYATSGRPNRGVKEQSLAVLARAGMPAVLTEIGFISNPEEERYMNSETGQKEIVGAIFEAINTYKKELEAN